MTTLIALTRRMESYNHAVAPGSKCPAWQKFIEECRCDLHRLPWSDKAENFVRRASRNIGAWSPRAKAEISSPKAAIV